MIDTKTRLSPGWRLDRLARKLALRQRECRPLYERYNGEQPLPEHLRDAPDTAKTFFRASRTAFAELIVKAVKYPLKVQSIATAVNPSDSGDPEADKLFRFSGMAAEIDDVHRHALISGNGYAIVNRYQDQPAYTAEDPRQVVTIHDPVRQAVVTEALKLVHVDDDERHYAYLYVLRPSDGGGPRVWRAYRKARTAAGLTFSPSWDWDDEYGGADGMPLPPEFGNHLPVFRYRNEEGVSEFSRHLNLLDRLDHMVLQGMVIATLQAFKQRAIQVSQEDMPDEDEETGEPINYDDVLSADPGALWKLPETAKVWESGNLDLSPVWTGLDKFTQQLSAVTFTPLSQFAPDGQNQSAAGAGFAREGRTFKVEDRQDRFGYTHADALALLFRLAGDEKRADAATIRPQWKPAQRNSLAEIADALPKFKAGGVPWRTRMIHVAQFTPGEVQRMESERMDDELLFPAQAQTAQADG